MKNVLFKHFLLDELKKSNIRDKIFFFFFFYTGTFCNTRKKKVHFQGMRSHLNLLYIFLKYYFQIILTDEQMGIFCAQC